MDNRCDIPGYQCLPDHYCAPLIYMCHRCSDLCRKIEQHIDTECKKLCPDYYDAHYGASTAEPPGTPPFVHASSAVSELWWIFILIACVIIIVGIVLIVVCIVCKKRRRKKRNQPSVEMGHLNDDEKDDNPIYASPKEPILIGERLITEKKNDKHSPQKEQRTPRSKRPKACSDSSTDYDHSRLLFNSGDDRPSLILSLICDNKPQEEKSSLLQQIADAEQPEHRFSIPVVDDHEESIQQQDKGSPTPSIASHNLSGAFAQPQSNVVRYSVPSEVVEYNINSSESKHQKKDDHIQSHRPPVATNYQFESSPSPDAEPYNDIVPSAVSLISQDTSVFDFQSSEGARDPGQRLLSSDYTPTSRVNREDNWNMVIRMYDIIDSKMNVLSYVAGCMIGGDALQVYVRTSPERDVEACYNEIINVLPNDPLAQQLLIVLPETSQPGTPESAALTGAAASNSGAVSVQMDLTSTHMPPTGKRASIHVKPEYSMSDHAQPISATLESVELVRPKLSQNDRHASESQSAEDISTKALPI